MDYSISEKVLNETMTLLSTQPYSQVFRLINLIQKDIKPIKEVTEPETVELKKVKKK